MQEFHRALTGTELGGGEKRRDSEAEGERTTCRGTRDKRKGEISLGGSIDEDSWLARSYLNLPGTSYFMLSLNAHYLLHCCGYVAGGVSIEATLPRRFNYFSRSEIKRPRGQKREKRREPRYVRSGSSVAAERKKGERRRLISSRTNFSVPAIDRSGLP